MRFTATLFSLMIIAVLSFTAFKPIGNNPAPWKFIGDKNVGWGVDHDVIHTGNVSDDFRQIKLKVTDGPLKMYDVKIYFDNGDVQDVAIRSAFRMGSESRIIDLAGGLRHLSKIEFWYETKGFAKGKARVAVWGRK